MFITPGRAAYPSRKGTCFCPAARPQDNNNLALEKGPSPFDINHRFVSDFLYELPFARLADASTRGKKLLLAGWQFAGIYSAESGFPFFSLSRDILGRG